MALSQSDIRPVIVAQETVRFAQIILILGGVVIFASFLRVLAPVGLGLRLGGVGLIFAGSVALAWKFLSQLRDDERKGMVMGLGELDPAPAILTRFDFTAVDRNIAASNLYGDLDLLDVLGRFVAHPLALTDKLAARMRSHHIASDEIVTPRGILALSGRRVGDDLIYWRLETQQTEHEDAQAVARYVMSLCAAADGAVLSVSPAMQEKLGRRCLHLKEVFAELPIRSGHPNRLYTESGEVPVLVQEVGSEQSFREIAVIERHDITAEADADGQLADQTQLPVPMLNLGLDCQILNANAAARQLLSSDIAPGSKLTDFVEGLGRPMEDWISEAAKSDGHSQPQFLRGTGIRKNLFLQVALCRLPGADAAGVIAVLHDVTEFKVLEAQFVQSQKMQAIGQLAGGVAHDFNNLLTAISGHCDLLLLRHSDDDPDFADLTQIHQNANRAAALVGQLLAYSRKQELQIERVDIRDALSDLTHLLNRLVGERISLTLRHDINLQSVMADKRQLEQVIMNLVVNARDAMEQGGQITIRTEAVVLDAPVTRDRATIAPGNWALIHVQDHGRGIPPEMLPHVFEPFYTTKGVGEGTGLGLSTVYGIVKQSGGFIFVDSVPGEGSTFTLYLPAVGPEAVESTKEKEADPVSVPSTQTSGVILLVEDEAPVRAFASRALKMRGYDVIEADCGEMALALLQDESRAPDLVVSDVVMPGVDGPTWVAQALETRPDMRVIFMSGYSEAGIRENRQAIANSGFLPKPFSLKDLLDIVEKQLAS